LTGRDHKEENKMAGIRVGGYNGGNKGITALNKIVRGLPKAQIGKVISFAEQLRADSAVKIDLRGISEKRFTKKLDGITFAAPVREKLEKIGVKGPRFNDAGILLYSGKGTTDHIDQIAKGLKIAPAKLAFPTKEQTQKMFEDKAFREALLNAGINWVTFIIDKSDKNKNVSLEKYWENRDQYRFCFRDIYYGSWGDDYPDYYLNGGAVILGGLK